MACSRMAILANSTPPISDGLARTQWHQLLKKFGCSERRRLNEKGVSNGRETPKID